MSARNSSLNRSIFVRFGQLAHCPSGSATSAATLQSSAQNRIAAGIPSRKYSSAS